MNNQQMICHWLSLWERIGARGNAFIPYADIYTHYSEKGRVYHNWNHIVRCITALDDVPARYFRDLDRLPRAVLPSDCLIEMILWGHDMIYIPGAKDNEEKSAEKMAFILKRARITPRFIDQTCEGILATKHTERPDNQAFWWALDIDLLSFGEPREVFEQDGKNIREEFRPLVPSDKDFEKGRRAALERFNRDPFYFTEYFEKTRGRQARENIMRALRI